jgi:hypothetical protein
MIGLTDAEFAMLRDTYDSTREDVELIDDVDADVIFSLRDRDLLAFDVDDDDVMHLQPTKLGRIVYRVEQAIRAGVPPLLESSAS